MSEIRKKLINDIKSDLRLVKYKVGRGKDTVEINKKLDEIITLLEELKESDEK